MVALIWKRCRQELSPPYELFVIARRAPPPPARCQLYVNLDWFSGLVAGGAARGRREQPRRWSEHGWGRAALLGLELGLPCAASR